ncbi:hypothetical protein M9H77_20946 [Catharanthus roseus]|uniref:Uncharacterized protein n=1 Tax=Catharanthus roseus TaxID=4058 RepID=A0ACC0ANW7_CATRO|nr:hypothetical protein M9H77_20946 [Catharanthus roseus]
MRKNPQAIFAEIEASRAGYYGNGNSITRQLGINVTKALLLPQRCSIPGDISACRGGDYGGRRSLRLSSHGVLHVFVIWF